MAEPRFDVVWWQFVSEDVFEMLSFPKVDQYGLDSDLERFGFEEL